MRTQFLVQGAGQGAGRHGGRSGSFRLSLLIGLVILAVGCQRPSGLRNAPSSAPSGPATSHTVVFIHGMFMTPASWQPWERLFRERGYKTLAPAWPLHDEPLAAQRDPARSGPRGLLRLDEVLDSYRAVLRTLPEKPILIGHSMGGLIVQLLLAEGLGVAGVAIDSAPPKGLISFRWSFLKSNWPVLDPLADLKVPITMSFEQFQYAFTNGMSEVEQRAAFDQYIVPESRYIGSGPTTEVARIDYTRARPPLLIVAGENDHIIPASLNLNNFHLYDNTPAVTEYREFPGRNHWLIADSGWQEVAGYILSWLQKSGQP